MQSPENKALTNAFDYGVAVASAWISAISCVAHPNSKDLQQHYVFVEKCHPHADYFSVAIPPPQVKGAPEDIPRFTAEWHGYPERLGHHIANSHGERVANVFRFAHYLSAYFAYTMQHVPGDYMKVVRGMVSSLAKELGIKTGLVASYLKAPTAELLVSIRESTISSTSAPAGKEIGMHQPGSTNVFVVHGRNLQVRDSMFTFLRAIGLHPIEWSEAVASTGSANPYVGQILDAAFAEAQAVVVLFTPDEEVRLSKAFTSPSDQPHETKLARQARPNVLFEAGMAMGRCPERTVLVEVGHVRPFSDIGGRHVIRLDNSSVRRQEFAQRLQAAGCSTDLKGTQWHSEGNFAVD